MLLKDFIIKMTVQPGHPQIIPQRITPANGDTVEFFMYATLISFPSFSVPINDPFWHSQEQYSRWWICGANFLRAAVCSPRWGFQFWGNRIWPEILTANYRPKSYVNYYIPKSLSDSGISHLVFCRSVCTVRLAGCRVCNERLVILG